MYAKSVKQFKYIQEHFKIKPSDITCTILTKEEEENKLNTARVHYTQTTKFEPPHIILLGW